MHAIFTDTGINKCSKFDRVEVTYYVSRDTAIYTHIYVDKEFTFRRIRYK